MTLGNWFSPFSRRHVFAAVVTSLKTISPAVSCDSAPLVRTVRCRTVATTLSLGFDVRRWSQCSGGEVVERQQPVAVLDQAGDRPLVFGSILRGKGRNRRFGRGTIRRCPDLAQIGLDRGLHGLGHLVEHVGRLVHCAALMPRRRADLLERLPEARRDIASCKFGRDRQAARLQVWTRYHKFWTKRSYRPGLAAVWSNHQRRMAEAKGAGSRSSPI